ncbi:hypothetical protein SALBM311S_01822 [Streptomyces alboniger]
MIDLSEGQKALVNMPQKVSLLLLVPVRERHEQW